MRDLDIRSALRDNIKAVHDAETLIVDELGLCEGQARVDIAVVNGEIHGIEIKSDHDTLARLPAQMGIYNRALDRVTIVTTAAHAEKATNAVPTWWGISIARELQRTVSIESVREPQSNPEVDMFAQAQLLWRDEALTVLEERQLACGVRHKPRRELWKRLSEELTTHELGHIVREHLKMRSIRQAGVSPLSGDGSCRPCARS